MTEFLVDSLAGLTRIAMTRGGNIQEIHILKDSGGIEAGSIFLGKIDKLLPKIGAGLVDIGAEQPGFLDNVNEEGRKLLVQVLAPPEADKGARLTQNISLSGKYLVLTPMRMGVSISKEILEREERDRLRNVMSEIAAVDEGVIVRTKAQGISGPKLEAELNLLREQWDDIQAKMATSKPPCLLYQVKALPRLLDIKDAKVIASNPETLALLKKEVPDIANLELYKGETSLFTAFGVEELISEATLPSVTLPSGGNIIIEETSAFVVIDVNAGRGSAMNANLEAVEVIAKQIILRNLSGRIMIDFIPNQDKAQRFKLVDMLRRALINDPLKAHVAGLTPLGAVELSRSRQGLSLTKALS